MAIDPQTRVAGSVTLRSTLSATTSLGRAILATDAAGSISIVDGHIPVLPLFDYTGNLFEDGRPGRVFVRPDDLLAVRIELRGLSVSAGSPPKVRKEASGAAYLIVHFPPQSFAEEVFYQAKQPTFQETKADETAPPGGGSEPLRPPPIRARIAEESRIAFRVPDGFEADYTIPALLAACETLPLSVAVNAKPRGARRPFRLVDLVNDVSLAGISVAGRAQLANRVASMVRIGAMQGDISTLRAQEISSGLKLLGRAGRPVERVPGVRTLAAVPREPGAAVTAIEMPWRLILSPHAETRWRYATAPVTSALTNRTELWHARLVAPNGDKPPIEPPYPDPNRTVRAIWARSGSGSEAAHPPMRSTFPTGEGSLPGPGETPFRMTLDDFDRFQIAHLSSNFNFPGYQPQPIDTNLMMLSALGGWLDSRGAWEPPGLSVEEWVHRSTMGRDHYVRVVYRGFLFPTGHRVSLVKESQRKFHNGRATPESSSGNIAYLRQRYFLVIREKERLFDGPEFLDAVSKDGKVRFARQFPFSRVRLLTETTPDLDDPASAPSTVNAFGQRMFWPHVGGKPFRFQCVATDLDGRRVAFDLPMIFVDNTLVNPRFANNTPDYGQAEANAQIAATEFAAHSDRNTAPLDLQRVAMAPSAKAGDTSVEVETLQFGGVADPANEPLRRLTDKLSHPIWLPKIVRADARIGAVANLTGKAEPSELRYNAKFLEVGFDDQPGRNRGQVFLDVKSGPNLDFSAQGDRSGGFVQPNLKPAALSRFAGPVMSDPAQFISGQMPKGAGFPTSIGDLPLPLLFGCIPLADIIEAVTDLVGESEKVPKFAQEAGSAVETFVSGLASLYSLLADLAAQPSRIGAAAIEGFKNTLDDLVDQAKAYAAGQMAPVEAAIDDVIDKFDGVATQLDALAGQSLETAVGAPLAGLATPLANARSSLTALKNAANAAPGGVALPAGLRQAILNLVAKADPLLAGLEGLSALVTAGKSLWDALDDIIGNPASLAGLLGDPAALGAKLDILAAAIGPFRTGLQSFTPLDGAPRQVLLSALDVVEQALNAAGDLAKLLEMLTGDELIIRFDWNPLISDWYLPGTAPDGPPIFRANDKKGFIVAVEARVKKSGGSAPKIGVTCGLKHFDLVLIGPASFLELNFEKIEFKVDSAAKIDVDVLLSDIKFVGPLSFVETLRDLIPLDGFSDPPYLDITPKGIDAGFDIALPSITLGVLNLSNLSLGAGFTVPFIGEPLSVRFNFCRREQPFLLTVYVFGGGGFFGVTIDPAGVQILEASFEFGAAISIDFGVASGGVHVMAGLYYRMEKDAASLTGYFRLGGHVDVLGLITASLELYLELRYEFQSGKCVGKAQLTISVKVFVFSGSVTITCERKFAGANGDPTLRQMLGFDATLPLADELAQIDADTEYAWREHLEAFA